MPMPCLFKKTVLAAVCSLSLLACGQKNQATETAPAAAPAPVSAESASAKSSQRATKDSGDSLSKMMADANSENSNLVQTNQEPAGGLPSAALAAGQGAGVSASEAALKGRKLVLTASARFSVKNTYQSALAIEDAVVAHDGYMVANDIDSNVLQKSQQHGDDGLLVRTLQVVVTGKLVVRVPSAQTQAFLRAIAGQIEALDQRNFAASDVQFHMLRAQLEAARNQDTQTDLGQLTQQKGSVGDKAQAAQARNEAKAARDEARIASSQLADQVAYSNITLYLHQSPQVRTTQEVDFESASTLHRPGFTTNLYRAVAGGWGGLLSALVAIAALWPLWLLLAAVAGGVMSYRSRRQKNQQLAS
jgi:Domain of unknown function (DUF4349)